MTRLGVTGGGPATRPARDSAAGDRAARDGSPGRSGAGRRRPGRFATRLAARLEDRLAARLEDRLAPLVEEQVRAGVDRRLAGLPDAAAVEQLVTREAARRAKAAGPDPGHRDRDFSAAVLLGTTGRSCDRTLSRDLVDALLAQVGAVTGTRDLDRPLQHAYRTLLDHEGRGLGRVAGTTPNILGKLLVPPLLGPPPGPVLEVGTLFGLFSTALVHQFQRAGEFRSLTVVDPFVGTQVQAGRPGRRDRTGTPVTEDVVRRNFRTLGLREDEVRLVRGYSEEPAVRRAVADRAYGVVVVDGDHAAAGVYRDLCWLEGLLAPGGVVVVDDWGDPAWPGVAAAGRRYLADGGRLSLLGLVATSAYLRLG